MAKLTAKRRIFIEAYLACWNATESARRAGYKHPNVQGPTLVKLSIIQEKIKERIAELKMSADEVLLRLRAQAVTDPTEFIDDNGIINWTALKKAAKERGGPLVKEIVHTKGQKSGIKFYDAQAALVHLGRHHGLFKDRVEHAGDPTKPIRIDFGGLPDALLRRLAEELEGGDAPPEPGGVD